MVAESSSTGGYQRAVLPDRISSDGRRSCFSSSRFAPSCVVASRQNPWFRELLVAETIFWCSVAADIPSEPCAC